MNPYTLLGALDRALKHVTTEPGTDAPETSPVRVAELEGRRVFVIGEAGAETRHALIEALARLDAAASPDPLLAPIPPAALAAFDVPAPVKKNRAQRRKEARRG